ncbi:MAG TPA: fimbrial protein [Limnobacter sp.]|nr:fimbrial protein [Limnobacter sp.]
MSVKKLCVALLVFFVTSAQATCYRVDGIYTGNGTPPNDKILPTDGVAGLWTGACATCGGDLGLPSVINVTDTSFQPAGSVIESSIAPFVQYGRKSSGGSQGYNPEQVFFRCQPNDAVYEMYANNGLQNYGGAVNPYAGFVGSVADGAFKTDVPDVLMRITHQETGRVFDDVWQERRLNNLDKDSRGYVLVKAKNLATIRVELIRAADTGRNRFGVPNVGVKNTISAMIAIKGPGILHPEAGASSATSIGGHYSNWPGAIGYFGVSTTVRRARTCAVLNVTPTVEFPAISAEALKQGEIRGAAFDLKFHCQAQTSSGTQSEQTAIGFLPSANAIAHAQALGLMNNSGGVSHIVSDQHGMPGIAKGVGVRIYRHGQPMTVLGGQRSFGMGEAAGWYTVTASHQGRHKGANDTDVYYETFVAELQALPTEGVSAGKVSATAQVLIRVQ